jgi:hypothetical protein
MAGHIYFTARLKREINSDEMGQWFNSLCYCLRGAIAHGVPYTGTIIDIVTYREIISLGDENTANARWEPAAQSPSRGSGDRRAVCNYKNVRNTYQITINVENDLHPLAHTPDTAVQGL